MHIKAGKHVLERLGRGEVAIGVVRGYVAEKFALVGLTPRERHAVVMCLDIEVKLSHERPRLRHHGTLKRAFADKELVGHIEDGESVARVHKARDGEVAPRIAASGDDIGVAEEGGRGIAGGRRCCSKTIPLFR